VEGGFDAGGRLTRDPAAIEASKRPLPIGYWKGSGLALMLDMSAHYFRWLPTHQIPGRHRTRKRIFRRCSLPLIHLPSIEPVLR